MKIALGCDHGGYELMQKVKSWLIQHGYEIEDYGTYSLDSCHYPQFGEAAARAVASGKCEKGVVICTTGIGISITANKVHGIRCALCTTVKQAEMTRRHNDSNMLALGAHVTDEKLSLEILETFLVGEFEGGRHQTRVDMIMAVEGKNA